MSFLGYEQLKFHNVAKREFTNVFPEECHDRNGELVHVGDYVRAVKGEDYIRNIEGYVEQILPYEEAGSYMIISSTTGRILESHANPLFYEVVSK